MIDLIGVKSGWVEIIKEFFNNNDPSDIEMLLSSYGSTFFPKKSNILRPFKYFEPKDTKVVIVENGPYYGPNQANGLAFGVNHGMIRSPSLRNIFKEVERSVGAKIQEGDSTLEGWAKQGVLLLNSIMTVSMGMPGSHAGVGWVSLTDYILKEINKEKGVVFILWGDFAKSRSNIVSSFYNLTLSGEHPSPESAYKGFFGCDHFRMANEFLAKMGRDSIDWSMVEQEKRNELMDFFLENQRNIPTT